MNVDSIESTMRLSFQMNAMVNNASGNFPLPLNASAEQHAEACRSQLYIIRSELRELLVALRAGEDSLLEIRDGVADVIVTADGLRHRLCIGAQPDVVGQAVVKFESDFAELDRSLQSFNENFHKLVGVQAIDYETLELLPTSSTCTYVDGDAISYLHGLDLVTSCYSIAFQVAALEGIPVIEDQVAVFRSNMSKFDTDFETAQKTIEKYRNMGIAVHIEEVRSMNGLDLCTFYIVKSSKDQDVGGKDYPKGKFLKSINFQEPVFGNLSRY